MHWQQDNLSKRTQTILVRLLRDYLIYLNGPTLDTKRIVRTIERSEQQEEIKVLTREQATFLIETAKKYDPRFEPILLLGLHAGLRRGEVFGLRCGDIDLFKKRLRIAHSYGGPTKSGKTRYVPMSDDLERAMIAARNLLMRPVDERVFETMNPNPRLRRLLGVAKLPLIRFHDLRHTFATMGLESGVSPRVMADWLGHSSVNTTLSIYWNLTNDKTDINRFLP
jgi:integrase